MIEIYLQGSIPFTTPAKTSSSWMSDSCVLMRHPFHSTGIFLTPTCLLHWIVKDALQRARDKEGGEEPLPFLDSDHFFSYFCITKSEKPWATRLVFSPCTVVVETLETGLTVPSAATQLSAGHGVRKSLLPIESI